MEDFDGLLSLLTLQLEALVEEVYNVLAGATTDECMKMVSSYLGSTEKLHRRTIESLIKEYRYGHA